MSVIGDLLIRYKIMGLCSVCLKEHKEVELLTIANDCEVKESTVHLTRTSNIESAFINHPNCEEIFKRLIESPPIPSEPIKVWKK